MKVPSGYRFASTRAGIRKGPAHDLTIMVSDCEAAAAAVFTRNVVRAAPVTLTEQHLRSTGGRCQAIVANAGNANCATPTMRQVARSTAKAMGKLLRVPSNQILLASTGVIGKPLDEGLIVSSLPGLVENLSVEAFEASAKAIMTTDTVPKTAFAELRTEEGVVRIAGMAKGAGMIHPNLATMLAFLFTDARVSAQTLRALLRRAVRRSFNCISVDSDMSTNDTVTLLANGRSDVVLKGRNRELFREALEQVTEELAVAIVRDGEGARKLLTIIVEGAPSDRSAVQLARSIANSPLVKTALAGADPNWGRILSSAGAGGIRFDPSKVDIRLNDYLVCRRGFRAEFSEEEVQASLTAPESTLHFHIRGGGPGHAQFWTCDLTEDYIRINADYRT